LANLIKADYGFYGVAIILLFYIFRNHKYAMAASFTAATIINYVVKTYILFDNIAQYFEIYKIYGILCFSTLMSLFFILLYNGKKGKNTKYLFYLFYPLHLLLLYGIYLLV